MKIRFWGTRGSIPAPLNAHAVEAKVRQAIRALWKLPNLDTQDVDAVLARVSELPFLLRGTVGGHTSCVEIRADGQIFIMDAGSGLHVLGLELMKGACGRGEGVLYIFLSHCHWDHLLGFPMFMPALVPGNRIIIYGVHDVRASLETQLNPNNWPVTLDAMGANLEFHRLQPGVPISIGKVRINTLCNTHPGDSYSYRFEDAHSAVVYASDIEFKELDEISVQPHIDFFRDADGLIFDTQYTLREVWKKVDWGHSSALIGVDLARVAGVKRLLLFHHDPTYSDMELQEIQATAAAYQNEDDGLPRCEIIVAYDGLELNLAPLDAVDLELTPDGETAILRPIRVFDELGVDKLAQQLADHSTASSIIDLSQVETLTTAGLKALVTLRQQRRGSPIVLVAPSENVHRVAALTGHLDYFAIYPTIEKALAAVRAREALNLPGQVLRGRYQIEDRIGEGALGAVLRATDLQTQQTVALKVLFPYFSQDTLRRFERQAQQIIALDHPHIIKVLAWEKEENYSFKVEAFVDAPTLAQRLEQDGAMLPNEAVMQMALDITQALEYAHSRGVIHGDLKPSNIFLTETGIQLSGFGQGRLEEGHNLLDAPLFFMTAAYLAPEQILGQPLDARADLYSLGVILYELFTGQLPFTGTESEVLQAHLHRAPCPPRELNPELSLSLEHLLLKLLSKNPNDRYASAQQAQRISSSLLIHSNINGSPRNVLLVGRTEQRQRLRAAWEQAITGKGQLVFVTGEPGIGKTSLVQQVAAQCQPPMLVRAQCQEPQRSTPYQLFSDVLRSYFATVPPEFYQEPMQQYLGNFKRIVPELAQMLPDLPAPPALGPEEEQLRLMASLTEFIRQATSERPWLLILDNLQWADSSSLELLRYLARHVATLSLLLVGIYSDSEVERGHLLRETLRDLSAQPSYQQITLGRLTLEDVRQVLYCIWKDTAPDPLVEKIYHHTGGNPFYVEEVAQGLMDDGLVVWHEGEWHFPELADLRLPQSVRDAVLRRIEHLSQDTKNLLSQAAVLGQTFAFEALREMSSLTRWEVLEHLDAALERNLIQEVPGENMLRFRHTEIQYVLYESLGEIRRRMLHRRAGEALEVCAQPEPEQIAKALARHFEEAGEFERGARYALTAGRQAQATYANRTARLWYERALWMLLQLGSDKPQHLRQLEIATRRQLGGILLLTGDSTAAREHLVVAHTLLQRESPSAVRTRQLAELYRELAKLHEYLGQDEQALVWLDKGRELLRPDQDGAALAHSYTLAGKIHLRQGNYAVAQGQLEHALTFAEQAHLPQVWAEAKHLLGNRAYLLARYPEAQQQYDLALQRYQQIGDRQGESMALSSLGRVYSRLGEFEHAEQLQKQALQIKRHIGDQRGEAVVLVNMGDNASLHGYYLIAREHYEQALASCREMADRETEVRALNSLGQVLAERGELLEARAAHQTALEIGEQIGDQAGVVLAQCYLGLSYLCLGDYATATAYFETALDSARTLGFVRGESLALLFLSQLVRRRGAHQHARVYAQQALTLAQSRGARRMEARAWTQLGDALAALAYFTEAADAYTQALALRERLYQPQHSVALKARLARVALILGDLTTAQAHIMDIVAYLDADRQLIATDSPASIYLILHQVLVESDEEQAALWLTKGHAALQAQAARLSDPEVQAQFLALPEHQELQAAFANQTGNTP